MRRADAWYRAGLCGVALAAGLAAALPVLLLCGNGLRGGACRAALYMGPPRETQGTQRVIRRDFDGFVAAYVLPQQQLRWVAYRLFATGSRGIGQGGEWMSSQTSSSVAANAARPSGSSAPAPMISVDSVGRCYGFGALVGAMDTLNLVPASGVLDGALWEQLRDREATYAESCGELWIVSGPLWESRQAEAAGLSDPDGAQALADRPSGFFAVLVDLQGTSKYPRVLALLVPANAPDGEDLRPYLVSVDAVEAAAGLDLFTEMPDEAEAAFEAYTASDFW